ncbi:hypothetical protein DUNSADRAFT_8183 [Dunaliella salina]|uniref:Encoded protein n=1 Tax=Dunaliella salina TaxID=3046 RepID=A0ABQ7GJY5_DUNSA|nr:hypothetical protein DUNSADRAFT_8183 [Dunaliella salina]|eukprot:KAF5834912.1 hypothetical protein DUNSADRAFT_8183 [Dunaliella salina]
MDAASFLEVVNNISAGVETSVQAAQSAPNSTTAPFGAQANPVHTEAMPNEQQVPALPVNNNHAFAAAAEPLLGFPNHTYPHQYHMFAAQPLVPIGNW